MYTLQGNLKRKEDDGWIQSESTLKWPKTEVPTTWMGEWYETLQDCLPEKVPGIVWTYRRSLAGITNDKGRIKFGGEWYERKTGRTGNDYEKTSKQWEEEVQPCEVFRRPGGKLWERGSVLPRLNKSGGVIKAKDWEGITEEGLRIVKKEIMERALECASDGSVKGGKKTVAVWMGNRKTEKGVMLTREVRGLPHNSGRAELDGPMLALQVLGQVKEKYGIECKARIGCDSAEVVTKWKNADISKIPSKCCSRNMDMWLRKEHLAKEYMGSLEVIKVKGQQDEEKEYEELDFHGRRNVDCDRAAKEALARAEVRDCIPRLYQGVQAMVWAEEGGLTVEPYDWLTKKQAKEVIMKRLRMRARVYEEVDWEMHGAALRQIHPRYRPQVLRGVWDEIPTQVKMKRNG